MMPKLKRIVLSEDEKETIWPKVSIIIVCFNHKHYLEGCLNSIHEQRYPSYEVILLDNASEDNGADFVSNRFADVRVIRNDHNVGFSEANNIGAKHASGSYLAFLNPDTKVDPDWLIQLVRALKNSRNAGMATPKILLSDDPGTINTCGNIMHFTGLTFCRGMDQPATDFLLKKEVDAVSGAAFIIRRSFFFYLGGFDETFFTYLEDTDLSIRSRLSGKTCLYVPDSKVYHDYKLRFGPRKTYFLERNRYLLLMKNFKFSTLFAILPALILVELTTWGFSIVFDRKNISNKWLAYKWIVENWKEIIEKKRKVEAIKSTIDRVVLSESTSRIPFEQIIAGPFRTVVRCLLDPCFYLSKRLFLLLI